MEKVIKPKLKAMADIVASDNHEEVVYEKIKSSPDISMLNKLQKEAYDGALEIIMNPDTNMGLIDAPAGYGKTFVVSKLAQHLIHDLGLTVGMAAPSNQAVNVLQDSVKKKHKNLYFETLHRFFQLRPYIDRRTGDMKFQETRKNPMRDRISIGDLDVIFVDECSQLQNYLFFKLIDIVYPMTANIMKPNGLKVIFLGDSKQIQPVNAVEKKRKIEKDPISYSMPFIDRIKEEYKIKTFYLDEPVRQKGILFEFSNYVRDNIENKDPSKGFKGKLDKDGNGLYFANTLDYNTVYEIMYKWFNSKTYLSNPNFAKVICYTNSKVDDYNDMIKRYIYGERASEFMIDEILIPYSPILDKEGYVTYSTNQAIRIEGVDIAYVTDNQSSIKVWNLKVSSLREKKPSSINVLHLDGVHEYLRILSEMKEEHNKRMRVGKSGIYHWINEFKSNFADVKPSYSITAHKAQGSTFTNVIFDKKSLMKRSFQDINTGNIFYTAISRASKRQIILE